MRSQVESNGIKLTEVHGIGMGLDPNIQQKKQVMQPIAVTKAKEVSQIKPKLGQGRAGVDFSYCWINLDQVPFRPDEVHSSGWKLVLLQNQCTVPENTSSLQGRAGLRCKIKTPVSLIISRPIVQVTEKPVEQPKVLVPKPSRIQEKIMPIPDYTIPHISSGDDSGSRMLKERLYRILIGKIPYIHILFTVPLLNQ